MAPRPSAVLLALALLALAYSVTAYPAECTALPGNLTSDGMSIIKMTIDGVGVSRMCPGATHVIKADWNGESRSYVMMATQGAWVGLSGTCPNRATGSAAVKTVTMSLKLPCDATGSSMLSIASRPIGWTQHRHWSSTVAIASKAECPGMCTAAGGITNPAQQVLGVIQNSPLVMFFNQVNSKLGLPTFNLTNPFSAGLSNSALLATMTSMINLNLAQLPTLDAASFLTMLHSVAALPDQVQGFNASSVLSVVNNLGSLASKTGTSVDDQFVASVTQFVGQINSLSKILSAGDSLPGAGLSVIKALGEILPSATGDAVNIAALPDFLSKMGSLLGVMKDAFL